MYTSQISCLLMFRLLSFVSSTGKSYEENGTTHFQATVKLTLQVLHVFYKIILICFFISLAFNMFFTLMLVEVKLGGILN